MNPRMTGKITKKYFGEPKTNPKGFWYRLDAVYVQEAGAEKGLRMSYFSNPPKDNPSAEAIEDRYPECREGMVVDIEYKLNGQYYNIEEMQPHGSTLPASDPVAGITRRVPDHLKPGPTPEEPLGDLEAPKTASIPTSTHAAPPRAPMAAHGGATPPGVADLERLHRSLESNDPQAWRIARSVAIKECNTAATGGLLPALAETWTGNKDTEIRALASVMARWIVEG